MRRNRSMLAMVGAVVLLGSLARAGDDDSKKLTCEEQRYVEVATTALPAEIDRLENQIAFGYDKAWVAMLRDRVRDLKAGRTPPSMPELDERNLKVGQVGHFYGGMMMDHSFSRDEAVVGLVSAPPDFRPGKGTFGGEVTPVILAGVRIDPTSPSEVRFMDANLVVTEKVGLFYVLRPLDIDVPRLTRIVHRKLQQR
jgi:hypothetical protein